MFLHKIGRSRTDGVFVQQQLEMPCSLIEIIILYVNNVLISPEYAYAVIHMYVLG